MTVCPDQNVIKPERQQENWTHESQMMKRDTLKGGENRL